jgi:hypothetical protein
MSAVESAGAITMAFVRASISSSTRRIWPSMSVSLAVPRVVRSSCDA